MFSKILIANRGEIALRVMRACRELGILTVAVYSKGDEAGLHAQLADESVCIGPPSARESYLNMHAVLSATVATGCTAIHPGYGFLSENATFAAMCKRCNIAFIGPDSSAMERMGHKMNARRAMVGAGVPVMPGSEDILSSPAEAAQIANKVGYPVMIKAASGGGGRGIRKVVSAEDIEENYLSAQAEALAAFGDGALYLEKCVENARHVEVQLLCDAHGRALHLFERDCSMQRRNQKVLEEAPCSALSEEVRAAIGTDAVKAARACGYTNAGTVEFLLEPNGQYYFMEMNARIQVEHPVTEAVTGLDLVKWQIRIAAGEKLPYRQEDIKLNGCAIECRINAEDPEADFRPTTGTVGMLHIPGGPGVRFDTLLYPTYTVPPYYDNMLGKLIVHAPDREEAIARMRSSLEELVIDGIVTNADFQMDLISSEPFVTGKYDTGTITELLRGRP